MWLTLKRPLPGKRAQLEMAPENRVGSLREESTPPDDAMDAAVLVLLTPVNEGRTREELLDWTVLLIRRNSYPGVHSGQIAFPGGKCEDEDADFLDTACREAFEETGVEKDRVEIVGPLTNLYLPASNYYMHPYLAVNLTATVTLDTREAVEYKNIPIRTFNPAAATMLGFDYPDGDKRLAPAWLYEGYTIWGATSMVLSELYHLVIEGTLARA